MEIASRRYILQALFSEGSQSRSYVAKDRLTNQDCILKAGSSIKEEALLGLDLNHPYIVRPFDFGIHPEIGTYAAYPKYSEPPLTDWCLKNSKDGDEFRRVVLQIAEVVAFIHHRGYLYHDFKPEHFLVGSDSIKVLDLGLCTKIDQAHSSNTFSGTFPYISPERLIGRETDVRSDIFAMGMMLLHLFFPGEDWSGEPSISQLQQLQKKSSQLKGFWHGFISRMTSLEPFQRFESVPELWKHVLPKKAHATFLLFPPSYRLTFEQELFIKEKMLLVQSSSQMQLQENATQSIELAFTHGWHVFSFDLRNSKPRKIFPSLCSILTEKSLDLFPAIESLASMELADKILLIFGAAETLVQREKSLFSFALSSFVRTDSFRVFITTQSNLNLDVEGLRRIEVPLLTLKSAGHIVRSIFPQNDNSKTLGTKVGLNHFTMDQVLGELIKSLPQKSVSFWPAAAKTALRPPEIEKLSPTEVKILASLALTGGSSTSDILREVLSRTNEEVKLLTRTLISKRYVHQQDGKLYLNVPVKTILKRMRMNVLINIAGTLLTFGPWDTKTHFRLAGIAGNTRLGALIATGQARKMLNSSGKFDSAAHWFWRAFTAGAKLPMKILKRLTLHYMKQGQMERAQKLLRYQLKKFGPTYKLADLYLEYYHRKDLYNQAISLGEHVCRVAERKKQSPRFHYFSAKLACFLVLDRRFDEAEKLLDELHSLTDITEKVQGLVDHSTGLNFLLQGRLGESVEAFIKASSKKHCWHLNSWVNLAIALELIGKSDQAERLNKKFLHASSRLNDCEKLSRGYTTLGVILFDRGRTTLARHYFRRSLHLARAIKNRALVSANFENIGETFKRVGYVERATDFYLRASRVAEKGGLRSIAATNCSNAALQYAIQGKFSTSLALLRKAARIQSSLRSKFDLGYTWEHLGLVYVLLKKYPKAIMHLKASREIFESVKSSLNAERLNLHLAFCLIKRSKLSEAKKILDSEFLFKQDSFESGLFNHVLANYILSAKDKVDKDCVDSLYRAEFAFRKTSNLFWLAKTYKLKSEYLSRTGHHERAALVMNCAANIFSRLGAKKVLCEIAASTRWLNLPELSNQIAEKLPYKVLVMIREVLAEPDPDAMIGKILTTSVEFSDMERAVLILAEDPPRIFKSMSLDEAAIAEICEISKSATEAATESMKPYIRLDANSDPYLKSKPSIIANRIMSIVCLPLRSGDRLLGVLYLDSKDRVETLASSELVLLEIFASIIGMSLEKALQLEASVKESEKIRQMAEGGMFPEIIGNSSEIREVCSKVYKLLNANLPVLITGETGTGKELVARVLHYCSNRKEAPFVPVDCSALSRSLLENEIFGHEKGAFTGAAARKKGLFEYAEQGTIFLDEIGEMPLSLQSKLLRFLQEGEYRRVGGTEVLRSSARIVLATNRNLVEMVKEKKFREDLYYRIKGVEIQLPSLKERWADLPLLARDFLRKATLKAAKPIVGFSPEALDLMSRYPWPGNIRELKNEIERIVALKEGDWIEVEDFDPALQAFKDSAASDPACGTLRKIEKEAIQKRLKELNWNFLRAAKTLGLTRQGLYNKVKSYNIKRK